MPQPVSLSSKERAYLQDALQMENLCIAKCGVYADQCNNQAMKSLLFDVARNKRQHANRLKQLLGRQSAPPAGRQYQ
ncbi:hypothetical protein [Anaeroselena agilis]|uniref:Ferritin n=1 Tax=Anaeroselena agilis TaxID=3063788 RepID=A0ABU3NX95_9FIRM|nr:hypothetical protein [Selenomonadales bacterium 4137-cl]